MLDVSSKRFVQTAAHLILTRRWRILHFLFTLRASDNGLRVLWLVGGQVSPAAPGCLYIDLRLTIDAGPIPSSGQTVFSWGIQNWGCGLGARSAPAVCANTREEAMLVAANKPRARRRVNIEKFAL
jgi:hypothetical protein